MFNYLDDILVCNKSSDEHIGHFEDVFGQLRDAGLTNTQTKWYSLNFSSPFLEHVVYSRGVSIDLERTQGICNFSPPKVLKGVARFMGMVNLYRRVIPHIAVPLNGLHKKGSDQGRGSQDLYLIIQPVVLHMPGLRKQFID